MLTNCFKVPVVLEMRSWLQDIPGLVNEAVERFAPLPDLIKMTYEVFLSFAPSFAL